MAAEKRPASSSFGSSQVVKRQRSEADIRQNGAVVQAGQRTGGLHSPVMELSGEKHSLTKEETPLLTTVVGHSGEVFATRFDPTGQHIASGSMDRNIMLWRTSGQCENYGVLSGHKGAVLDLHWSRDARILFSASADATIASWDTETGQRLRRHQGHDDIINSLDVSRRGEEMFVSASDDGYIGLWDPRQKAAVDFIETEFPVTAVALAEAGNELYSGGIDNDIHVWDLRKKGVAYDLKGHADTITSLSVSPDSQYLLSNSHDSTVRTWDIRPFAPTDRQVKTYDGAPTGLEKNLLKASWDETGQRIAAGSGDRTVVIWETRTAKLLNKLPGHKGAVNDARFHPKGEPLIMTGSSDHNVLLGELTK